MNILAPMGTQGTYFIAKGPDGQSSYFTTELTSTPEKQLIDEDNIPAHEPGEVVRAFLN